MAQNTRILILGGGFGGVLTAHRLEKLFKNNSSVEITLVSRENFLLMTPLMFEACTGTLELRHCSVAIRAFLRKTRFIEGTVRDIDLEKHLVKAAWSDTLHELPYDHLVLALGAVVNTTQIPGSEHAMRFKTLSDVIVLRNHLIECFERADVETHPDKRRKLLTIAVIGGGFVGAEVFGELTAFIDEIIRYYPAIRREELHLHLIQAGPHIMPEVNPVLAEYAARILSGRKGVEILTSAPVQSIEPSVVHLKDSAIESETIILSAGILPSPVIARLNLPRDHHGRVLVAPTLRCNDRPEVWALGDCASVPDPQGKPYAQLAQFAMRQALVVADNLHASLNGRELKPFTYKARGLLAAIGRYKAIGSVMGINIRGFFAWWFRRTYYLSVMPRWSQRIRIVADWTLALFFRPEISKVDLGREQVARMRRDPDQL
jgi:NADH dehydrogenase